MKYKGQLIEWLYEGLQNLLHKFEPCIVLYRRKITETISWVDRNYNLVFDRGNCIKLIMIGQRIIYNDILESSNLEWDGYPLKIRCLGKNWYKCIK